MFISSQSKLSMESKKFYYKSFKAHQPKEGYEIKSQNYEVIWSQIFILSQSKLSIKLKKFFDKRFKAHQPKLGYGRKSQNYALIWSQMFISTGKH